MSTGIALGFGLLGIAVGAGIGLWLRPHGRLRFRERPQPVRRVLLPFTEQGISRRAFEAAVRPAKAENATITPAFLARVPRQLPLESALPGRCGNGMPLVEAIEQRLTSQGDQTPLIGPPAVRAVGC